MAGMKTFSLKIDYETMFYGGLTAFHTGKISNIDGQNKSETQTKGKLLLVHYAGEADTEAADLYWTLGLSQSAVMH